MTQKFGSLRSSKGRKTASEPFHETTNSHGNNVHHVSSTKASGTPASKRKRCPSDLNHTGSPPRRTRPRQDSDATLIPSTPKANRSMVSVAQPVPLRPASPKKVQFLPRLAKTELEIPDIPDEDEVEFALATPVVRLRSPPPFPYSMSTIPKSPSPVDDEDGSVVSDASSHVASRLRRTKRITGYSGLRPSPHSKKTIMSLLDVQLATPYPAVWDLGGCGPDDALEVTLQLRFRSLDLLGYHRDPPQEIYLRVASASYPRFSVPESTRSFEAVYLRTPRHPKRTPEDNKDLWKGKGWRFKEESWVYDVVWKVTPNMFTRSLATRKFTLQAEIKVCETIVTSVVKDIHITNFMTCREMGLVPFPERLRQEVL